MANNVSRILMAVVLCAGMGCRDDRGGSATEQEIESACESYCQKARTCDDEVSTAECTADCRDRMGDCMADEQAQAVDDLEQCAADACDDFTGCTIGAGLQCAFGL